MVRFVDVVDEFEYSKVIFRYAYFVSVLSIRSFLYISLSYATLCSVSCYEFKCPKDWQSFEGNCYQFMRSPAKNVEEAKERCSAYNAFLLSVLSTEEHQFITEWLRQNDPIHMSWYTSALDTGNNAWRWDVPVSRLSQTGSSSGMALGSQHSSSSLPGSSSGRDRQYYSIIAAFWLPSQTITNQQPVQQTISTQWNANLAKHAVYKFVYCF